jgi:hypothetical protein
MKFSIVIVTRNSRDTIGLCLDSIAHELSGESYEVTVVDNQSRDGTQNFLRQRRDIRYIENSTNRGFAYACAQGVTELGKYLLFLNPDVVLTGNVLSEAEKIFNRDPAIGIIGPKIVYVYPGGGVQRSVRRFPDVVSQALIVMKLHHLVPNLPSFTRYFLPDFDYEREQVVDQVMGACFFTRRSLWDELGGFDTRFFIWFEEVDYCLQAKRKGFTTVYAPIGPVVHFSGISFRGEPFLKKQFWYARSLITYFLKNGLTP